MMARPFSAFDAKRLIDRHKNLRAGLEEVDEAKQAAQEEISSVADKMVTQELLEILQDIPIEEINRKKSGFRIKALRDYGYCTIADIATASVYNLASIRGISEDSAYSIHREVKNIVNQARVGIKIRLNLDEKTPATTNLVLAIAKYRMAVKLARIESRLSASNEEEIDDAIQSLTPLIGGIKWFFASKERKAQAIEAYRFLQDSLEGEYGQTAKKAIKESRMLETVTEEEAWTDFAEHPIQFFNTLEKVAPGILGTGDAVYGLPEELAKQVQEECFFPDGLLCELRRYQEWGVKYILHQERVLLGDEMGLGKTIQAIATMVSLKNTGATHFVVVCPASVITNWCREISKQSRLRVIKIHGQGRQAALREWIRVGGVAVTTYETTGYFSLQDNFRFTLLVVDEAHYIKNPQTRRTVGVRTLAAHAQRLLFMTGTAIENNVDEMIELINMLQPEVACNIKQLASLSSAPRFREEIAPVYYRRKREDVLKELPELVEAKEWCTLSGREESVYEQAVLSKNYAEARRVSWNVDDLGESSKAKRMLEIIQEAESEGRKVIVFSFFLDTIRKIAAFLGDRCMNPINGSVTPQRRQEILDAFEKEPAGAVLPAQIQSGGTGLNIQSASVVILCEPQFKPSIENQAISRAYRMGQTRNVLVYRLLCADTVDEKIVNLLEDKQAIFDAFADKSVAAQEEIKVDGRKFGDIINEEIERIQRKNEGNSAVGSKVEV